MSLQHSFPNLLPGSYQVTSPPSLDYNRIAWAAGDDQRWWWPDDDSHWPGDRRDRSASAFCQSYGTLGYVPTDNSSLEPGLEKIALYADRGRVTHAARQLANGRWTSKLGMDVDIEHDLPGLEGPVYGKVIQILMRRLAERTDSAP
jgi:hypothetical protein